MGVADRMIDRVLAAHASRAPETAARKD
jgi:hypothetical protein